MSNPFKVLGITPEVVRDLRDEQLFKHAKFVYKSLLLLFHPDISGADKIAKELNIAIHELEYPERFLAAKNDYIKKKLTKSQEILRMGKQLAEKDKKLTTFKEEYGKNSWQFLGNDRKLSLVPNREIYLLLDPLTIIRLNSYSPTVDLYNVFDGIFLKLTSEIFGFINTELMREKRIQYNTYASLKERNFIKSSDLIKIDEDVFKKTRSSFVCTDVVSGAELVLYDREKRQYIIVGNVINSSGRIEDVLDRYSEKMIRSMHVVDKESPWKHFKFAIETAKKIGCKNHCEFGGFLGELSQVAKIFQSHRGKKTKEETMKMVEEVLKMKTYSWRWISENSIKEIATEYLMAGKSLNGFVAILKTLSLLR